MKITAIKQQVKRTDRYSVFVEDKYSFSLSESALLGSGLASGQELTAEQVKEYKLVSADDKVYNQALRYVAMRPRSFWEMQFYLERKGASPTLTEYILSKLSNIGMLDDKKYAQAFVNDRKNLRPTSRRKIIAELRKKRISDEVINGVIGEESDDVAALKSVIESKRRQAKYQDDLKLMQYLARQGFNYDDIKTALGL
jgi:regulatory protein